MGLRPNKEISVFRVTGKKYNFMHFERQFCLSKCIKYIFIFLKEKNVWVTLNTGGFFYLDISRELLYMP